MACNGAVDPATMFVQPMFRTTTVDEIWTLAEDLAVRLTGKTLNVSPLETRLQILQTAGSMSGEKADMILSNILVWAENGGILYLDEINAMPARIAMVLHGALDLRRTLTIPQLGNRQIVLHPTCQVIASYNPNYHGTKPLGQALKNRFAMQLPFDYDREIESKLVLGIPSLLDLAGMLRNAGEQGNLETPVGPNMLLEFEEVVSMFNVDFAVSAFVNRFEPEERSSVRETITTHFIDRIRDEASSNLTDNDAPDDEEVSTPANKRTPKKGTK